MPRAEEAPAGEDETDGFVDGARHFRRAVTHPLRWDLARDELSALAEVDAHVRSGRRRRRETAGALAR